MDCHYIYDDTKAAGQIPIAIEIVYLAEIDTIAFRHLLGFLVEYHMRHPKKPQHLLPEAISSARPAEPMNNKELKQLFDNFAELDGHEERFGPPMLMQTVSFCFLDRSRSVFLEYFRLLEHTKQTIEKDFEWSPEHDLYETYAIYSQVRRKYFPNRQHMH